MIFSLDVRRARKGDCLLLHFGPEDSPGLVLIDGGPSSVYAPHLRPRLLEIKAARQLDGQQPLPVDVLMVSHVDDDHIRGILDLTRELRSTPGAPLVHVQSFWHNSFDDIIENDATELVGNVTAAFGPASVTGELPEEAAIDSEEDEEVVLSSLKVLASIEQGHRLRGDIEAIGGSPNAEFGGRLIMASKSEVDIAGGLSFLIAGPLEPELKKLQQKHAEWLADQQKKKTTGADALSAYVDKSVPNLSSIVTLAKVEDKRMLLTGDARGDKILEGLETVGLLKKGGGMHVDILKVPHHGSSNNLEDDFFQRITADHYVFSGNGEHGNPERESLQMLFDARRNAPFQIHLTYPIKEIDEARKADWEKEQAKEKKKKAAGGKKQPRPDWDGATNSLAAFFEKNPLGPQQKLHIAPAKKPHVIDLLDPLGF